MELEKILFWFPLNILHELLDALVGFFCLFFKTKIGGPTEEGSHELLWHEVTNFRPYTICLECGQVFKLVKVEGGDHGHGDHGDHGHHH